MATDRTTGKNLEKPFWKITHMTFQKLHTEVFKTDTDDLALRKRNPGVGDWPETARSMYCLMIVYSPWGPGP